MTLFKRSLHQLDEIDAFDDDVVARLHDADITTAEEFVGAFTADPQALSNFIDLAVDATKKLRDEALAACDDDLRDVLTKPAERFGLGAIRPSGD